MGAFHPTSTCAMGRVVDSDLRVYGIDGLRVADGSIIPSVVRANTNAAIVMIGEKAADLVRGQEEAPTAGPPPAVPCEPAEFS